MKTLLPLCIAVSITFTTGVRAQALTDTLKKIKEKGIVVVGIRDSSIPFSYYDKSQKPIGYAMDLSNKIVENIKNTLNMPNLKIRYNLITSQTRIPLIQNGTVDFECSSTTNNADRGKQVDFSVGFFEVGTRLLVAKNSGIKDYPDLKGKNVVVTAGTTSERIIRAMNASKRMGMKIIAAKDHGESFLALESNRALAFMIDDILLAGEIAKAKNPANWHIVGTPQSYEIYGCMVRKNDLQFKKVVDDALRTTYKSGEINTIYKRWMQSPIPPKGINLNFPMNPKLKALLANPTDKPAQ